MTNENDSLEFFANNLFVFAVYFFRNLTMEVKSLSKFSY